MKVTDIILTEEQIAGTIDGNALALSMTDGYEYSEGKRTDNMTHKKVEAVMIHNKFNKVIVKVKGTKHPLTNELIAQQGGSVKVKFKNLQGKFYRTSSGEYTLTSTADGVEVVS